MERSINNHALRERTRRNISYPYTVFMHIYNEEDHLRYVFDAIERQTVKPLAVVVVDDGSTDGTHDIIHEYGYIHEVLNQKPDLYKPIRRANAFNHALGLAKKKNPDAKYYMKVDGDTLVYDSYAEQTIEYMEKNPRYAAVSGVSVRYIKTRDLNNGAVTYLGKTLPNAKLMYGWDREIQLSLVRMGYKFHVIRTLGYGEMRRPLVGSPGVINVAKNRSKSRIAEVQGFFNWLFGVKGCRK